METCGRITVDVGAGRWSPRAWSILGAVADQAGLELERRTDGSAAAHALWSGSELLALRQLPRRCPGGPPTLVSGRRACGQGPWQRLVAIVEDNDTANAVATAAVRLAALLHARVALLEVIEAWPPFQGQLVNSAHLRSLARHHSVPDYDTVRASDVADAIARYVDAGTITTLGATTLRRRSLVARVVRRTAGPVVLVGSEDELLGRSQGFAAAAARPLTCSSLRSSQT